MFQAIWLVRQFTPFSDILFLQSHVWSWRQKQNGWHGVLPKFRVRILENPRVDVFKVKKTLQTIENSFSDLLLLNVLFCFVFSQKITIAQSKIVEKDNESKILLMFVKTTEKWCSALMKINTRKLYTLSLQINRSKQTWHFLSDGVASSLNFWCFLLHSPSVDLMICHVQNFVKN